MRTKETPEREDLWIQQTTQTLRDWSSRSRMKSRVLNDQVEQKLTLHEVVKICTYVMATWKTVSVVETSSRAPWISHVLNKSRGEEANESKGSRTVWAKKTFNSLYPLEIDPLHPNISVHILHTVLCTFPKVLTRRICLTIKSFFSWWSFPLFSLFNLGVTFYGEFRCQSLLRVKRLILGIGELSRKLNCCLRACYLV